MNRSDFQELAQIRLEDAQILLEKGRYSGAYYLAGYAVECGLKACIAKKTRKFDFPPDPTTIRDIYVHDLEKLIKAAELRRTLDEALEKDSDLEVNWALVKDWNEKSRYEKHTKIKAQNLYDAVTDKKHGVLQWINRRW
ncbi:MAG: HEPN domain-containing protein [Sedimentisphaerales bacterium]